MKPETLILAACFLSLAAIIVSLFFCISHLYCEIDRLKQVVMDRDDEIERLIAGRDT